MSNICQSISYAILFILPRFPIKCILFSPFGAGETKTWRAEQICLCLHNFKYLSQNSDSSLLNPKFIHFLSNFCHLSSLIWDYLWDTPALPLCPVKMRVRETTPFLLSCQWLGFSSTQWTACSVFLYSVCAFVHLFCIRDTASAVLAAVS